MKKELILGLSLVLFPIVSPGQRLDQSGEPRKGAMAPRGKATGQGTLEVQAVAHDSSAFSSKAPQETTR